MQLTAIPSVRPASYTGVQQSQKQLQLNADHFSLRFGNTSSQITTVEELRQQYEQSQKCFGAGVNLPGKELRGSLPGAELRYANFQGSGLFTLNLNRANLNHANLSQADLRLATLDGTDLSLAKLNGADLEGTQFMGTDITGTDFTNAKNFYPETQLVGCFFVDHNGQQNPKGINLDTLDIVKKSRYGTTYCFIIGPKL